MPLAGYHAAYAPPPPSQIVHSVQFQTLTLVLYDSGTPLLLPPLLPPPPRPPLRPPLLLCPPAFPGPLLRLPQTCLNPESETWLPDEEIGRAEVALSSLDLSPGARNDLQLRVVPPYRQQHSR